MKSFYHCNTSRYGIRSRRVILLTGAIAAEGAVISFIVLFFGVLASGDDMPAGIPAAAAHWAKRSTGSRGMVS